MKKGLMRGLAGIMAAFCAIFFVAATYAHQRAAFINTRLGTTSVQLVETSDNPEDSYRWKSEFSSLGDLYAAKTAIAAQISAEGSVLLKNDNGALPLTPGVETVTLWGHNSVFTSLGGMIGSSAIAAEGQETASFMSAMASHGLMFNEAFLGLYTSDEAFAYTRTTFFPGAGLLPSFEATFEPPAFYMPGEIPASMYTDDLLATADGTAAIVVITRDNSEAADYAPTMFCATEGDSFERPLALSQYEKDMIELAKAHSTKVIVLINSDCAFEVEDLKNDPDIDAILWIGAPGLFGLNGVADVLSGVVSPSGHLADTYAVNSTSSPAMQNFGLFLYANNTQDIINLNSPYIVETEGIYNGYKYYETRYEDQVLGQGNATNTAGSSTGAAWNYADEVSYPFGYGMSYTTFEQKLDSVVVNVNGGTATATVTNTGSYPGKSVVELFVQTPYTNGGVEKSSIQLVGFAKTEELAPGASQTVTINIDPALFASYDENAIKGDGTQGAWVLEAGDYYFAIGNGSHEALNNVLALKTGSTDGLITINDDEVINPANAYLWKLAATDIETSSVNVQNALQDMDINKLIPGTAEYTTRADWSRGWAPVTDITPTDEMMIGLMNDNYSLNANGEGVVWGADNGLTIVDMITTDADGNVIVADISDPRWQSLVEQIGLDEAIQFIECGGDDIENLDSVMLPRTYMNDGPIGFAYDQIAGYKTRWNANDTAPTKVTGSEPEASYSMATNPTEPIVASTFNVELIEREGQLYGEDALWAKESVCICPGVNIHRTPYCARNHEYYSEDPVLTNLCAMAFCKGASSKGLATQAKHYAFNHQELNRSGLSTFMTEQAARENELRCFQGVMSTNTTATVMTAFNRAGVVFAGADEGILVQIARNEWGYEGAFVTDMAAAQAAEYMNWIDTVAYGGGIMLASSNANFANTSMGIMENSRSLIASDTYYQTEMQKALKTWLWALAHTNITNGLTSTTVMKPVTPWWQTTLNGVCAGFGILTALCAFLSIRSKKKA
ncbi:MAG: glycoside hydrolase family 3 C-terminal domain-containing protein [Atopobiaceae bacterium]|nr:glycoside hydrolase family 3 C-terminal domain-containing protein [Atopobiaceae bacterium]